MKSFLKSSLVISGTELALVLISIIRSKYLAVSIGPEGLGLFSLLNSFFLIISGFCGGWFSVAYIKFIAEYNKKKDFSAIRNIHNSIFTITCILLFISIVVLLSGKTLIKNIFLSPQVLDFHYTIFLGVFTANCLKSLYEQYLNAVMLTNKTAKSRILSSIFEFFSILILVYFFNLSGFFISLILSSLFALLLYKTIAEGSIKAQFELKSITFPASQQVLKYGSFNFFLLILNHVCQYFYRALIVSTLSFSHLGLFHATTALMSYTGIFNKGSNYTFIPSMGQEITNKERNKALNEYLSINMAAGILISSIAILFVDQVILLLYSKAFSEISNFSHLFISAQFMFIFVAAFQSVIVGTNNYRVHSIVVAGTNLLTIAIPYFYIHQYGLFSIAFGMMAASMWSICFNYTFLRKKYSLHLYKKTILGILLSLLLLSLAVFLKKSGMTVKMLFTAIECLLVFFIIDQKDRNHIFQLIKKLTADLKR